MLLASTGCCRQLAQLCQLRQLLVTCGSCWRHGSCLQAGEQVSSGSWCCRELGREGKAGDSSARPSDPGNHFTSLHVRNLWHPQTISYTMISEG